MEQLIATSKHAPFGKRGALLLASLAATLLVSIDGLGAARRAPAKPPTPKGPQCPSVGMQTAVFGKALSGSTFVTADGKEIRLAGVLAPGEGGEVISSLQSGAPREALAAILSSGTLTLAGEADARDRYGRMIAQVFVGEAWVQASLLRVGEIRVAPDRVSAPCAKKLLAAEDEARVQRAGHWRDGLFLVRRPEQIGNRVGTFQTVEGTVQSATLNKGRAYINFGADYRSDFTVTVSPQDMKLFRQARFDVKTLTGQRVRVRGWIELYNGPEMELSTPAAIETLN